MPEPKDRSRTMKRPDPPHRNSSFSKRHASFDSPREIPLPSPSSNTMRAPPTGVAGEYPVFSDDSDWELIAPGSSKLHKDKSRPKPKSPLPPPSLSLSKSKSPLPSPSAAAPPPLTPPASPPSPKAPKGTTAKLKQQQDPATILPYSRPYSLPEAHSYSGRPSASANHDSGVQVQGGPTPVDRSSSASLPLPMQVHFSALPKRGIDARKPNLPSPVQERTEQQLQLRPQLPPKSDSAASGGSNGSSGSTGSLPSAPPSGAGSPPRPAARSLASDAASSLRVPSPASASASASARPSSSPHPSTTGTSPAASAPAPRPSSSPAPAPAPASLASSTSSIPRPYSSSGAAPMPPADLVTAGSMASYRPPRTTFTPIPPEPPASPLAGATAINRSGSLGRFPPPEPPVILPTAPDALPDAIPPHSRTNSGSTLTANRASSATTNSSSSTGGSSGSGSGSGSGGRSRASYEPFLNHAPPPVDSWIEVETTQGEYRLIVRLPGFKRDGITLATKKRRILHLVADAWDDSAATSGRAAGGGHFERRISFGYDADLAQVRAEFDGEILRVIIPRKAMGMGMGVRA